MLCRSWIACSKFTILKCLQLMCSLSVFRLGIILILSSFFLPKENKGDNLSLLSVNFFHNLKLQQFYNFLTNNMLFLFIKNILNFFSKYGTNFSNIKVMMTMSNFNQNMNHWDWCVPSLRSLLPLKPAVRRAAFDHSCVQFPCRYLFLHCDLIS